MVSDTDSTVPQGGPEHGPEHHGWDVVVDELRRLRTTAGDPSYAVIAQRVVDLRVDRGESPHAARVARSTVYDTFRSGRTRVDVDLVRDVARALGATDADVDRWLESRAAPPDEVPRAEPTPVPAPAPAPVRLPAPEPPAGPGVRAAALLVAGCVLLNLLGRLGVDPLDLPLHLDMVGTAIAAIALGPWRGVAVGVLTNVLGVVVSGPVSLPFALVNVAGALVWGYGVRRWGLGRTLPRFLGLNVLVAVVSTAVALLVAALLLGDPTGRPEAPIAEHLRVLSESVWLTTGVANLLVSLADKVITGFVALVAVSALPVAMRRGLPLLRPGAH